MKIAKLGFLALFPVLMAGCVIDDGAYGPGYSSDRYYVDSYGRRHYRHHNRYRGGSYSGTYGGQAGGGYSGSYGGAPAGGYPHNAAAPVNAGGSYSASTPNSGSGPVVNPSRPSGFGRSVGVSPVPTTSAPPSAPHGGFSASHPSSAAPAQKIILNKPNPSLPHGPSSTHVLTPEKMKEASGGFSGTVGTAH